MHKKWADDLVRTYALLLRREMSNLLHSHLMADGGLPDEEMIRQFAGIAAKIHAQPFLIKALAFRGEYVEVKTLLEMHGLSSQMACDKAEELIKEYHDDQAAPKVGQAGE